MNPAVLKLQEWNGNLIKSTFYKIIIYYLIINKKNYNKKGLDKTVLRNAKVGTKVLFYF